METFKKSVEEIRQLSQKKATISEELLIEENAAFAEFCIAEGIRNEQGEVPEKPVKYLIRERAQLVEQARSSEEQHRMVAEELSKMKKEMKKSEGFKLSLEKQV